MMDAELKAARGAASLYFASVLSVVLNTGYLVLLTNLLPQQTVGSVALLNVLVIGIATASAFGIPVVGAGLSATPPAVARFLSEYTREGNGRAARRVVFISLIFCALISSLLAYLLIRSISGPAAQYAALDGIAFGFAQIGAYSLIGTENAGKAGVLIITSALLRYAAASGLLVYGLGAAGVFEGFIVGDAFLAVSGVVLAIRALPSSGSPSIKGSLYSYMSSVLLSGLIGLGVSQSDRLIAFFQRGLGDLAVYNIAAVGASIAAFAPLAVTNALVPVLPMFGGPGSERRTKILRDYTRYVSLVAMPVGFGLAAISPLLLLVFGKAYVQGAPLVTVMAMAIGLTAVSSVYASGLLASGKTYLFLVGNALALVSLIAVSYVLIPIEGLLGIAIGRAAMLTVSLACFALFSRTLGELVLDSKGYLKSILASAVMFSVVYALVFFVSPHLPLREENVIFALVLLPFGLVFFIVIMKALRAFGKEDFDFLERLLPRFMKPVMRPLRRLLE